MARTRLIGNFGKLSIGSLGSAVTTGTLEDGAFYIIGAIGSSTQIPAGSVVGYGFTSDGTEDLTASGGDSVKKMTWTDLGDVQSWNIDLTSDETDVTILDDNQKVYIAGRADFTGSIEGVFTLGTTDGTNGFLTKFVDKVAQADDGGALTITTVDNERIFVRLVKQKDDSSGETETWYVAPITVTSFSDTVSGSDAQAYTTNFRLTADSEVKFFLYANTIA